MISRNQIRQTAVQFIYSTLITADSTDADELWNMLLEPKRNNYYKLRAKQVCNHLTRDYSDKLRLFITRAKEIREQLQNDAITLPVRDNLDDLLSKEGEFSEALTQAKKALHTDPQNERQTLTNSCETLQQINTTLIHMRERFLDSLKDYPSCNELWPALTKAINRLQTNSNNIDCIIHPEGNPALPEVINVVEAGKDVDELLNESKAMAEKTLHLKDELNTVINATLENYSPERVTAMDRAILLLAAMELRTNKELAAEVIIKEAIRLAENYSTLESVKFINGILAKLAQSLRAA